MTAQTEDSSETTQALNDRVNNRSHRPNSRAFRDFVAEGWDRTPLNAEALAAAGFTPERRAKVSAAFPGERLVIPAGGLKVRSNDTDYRFRAHSAFIHLTGLEGDSEPDAVLVFEPTDDGHTVTLYFRPRAGSDTEEFFSDSRYGEYWVGPRADLEAMSTITGIATESSATVDDAITKDLGAISVRLVRQADVRIDSVIDLARTQVQADLETSEAGDAELAQTLSELRLIKDEHEVEALREAVAITRAGFDNVVAALPQAVSHRRGERIVETAFETAARSDGNGVGYDTIAASGNHACTLHWIRNDGQVHAGDLILVDAGAEADSLYTADITRTLPVSGTFSEVQAKIYDAVLDAADAAFAVAAEHVSRPVRFREVHEAAMAVIAARLEEFGILPVSAAESLSPEGQQHRRWMVHGTSHHLGLDVHDCAQARAEMYLDAVLEPGMVFTIEPGLYFKTDDLLLPEEFRGSGVRIEDDVLVTDTGVENLSADFPRTRAEIEAWVQGR
ncbi:MULTISPECIES: aminopeptidase P family protein [unclassified Brevibacterium]|uniref:aminopeptidase P family protein n=1 Tax=unclassified Brevibacterium TaxID=2614124 RepID=UPI001E47F6F4|nr:MULTISPECIES: aminopeptidase P family protein [unclassified Brevibacterium]MCD1284608.1 Xaa-Pro aminopeptidase [Brevibacterium sp. CCUG 69071]MDK8435774.1 aminopeptidase P family protein [Brevibacterium sp. H-BE7]